MSVYPWHLCLGCEEAPTGEPRCHGHNVSAGTDCPVCGWYDPREQRPVRPIPSLGIALDKEPT